MNIFNKIALGLVFCFFLSPAAGAFAATEILNIRHWVAPDNTRVVIDTDEEAQTIATKTDRKVSIDFKDAEVLETVPVEEILNKPGIHKILVLPLPDKSVRIEVWLADYVQTRVFKLKAVADKSFRVVIDIELPEIEKKESEERKQLKTLKRDKIIIIDAGHGGDDPGAIGRKKTKEKDVVLRISQKLAKILNKKEGYRAFLTRRGDYYPSFKKRLQIAREYGADLFLSIHADAVRNRSVRGSSVYCLSTTGASSVAARLLASQENLADIIGGTENDQGNGETDFITLHMVQTETMNVSKNLATTILRRLRTVNPLKFRQVQYAPFRVLKMPEIPSVLVETAYISNPQEEMLLRNPSFQTKIAEAIAVSVEQLLPGGETATPVLAGVKETRTIKASAKPETPAEPRVETVPYRVKRGDTLDRIARKHQTTIAALLKLNRMKLNDPLYADRTLKVPSINKADEEPDLKKHAGITPAAEPAPEFSLYTVRRGDTLDRIARKNKTTVAVLLKMNRMKFNDPLYVNRRLKVPAVSMEVGAEKAATEKSRQAKPLKPRYYKVKRGDTLEKIARKHDTTIAALLKANRMKLRDPLYTGRKLKIP